MADSTEITLLAAGRSVLQKKGDKDVSGDQSDWNY